MRKKALILIVCLTVGLLLSVIVGRISFLMPVSTSANLTVSAAISLSKALQDIKVIYEPSHPPIKINYNFAASGALQQQIEQGAPADIFFSAASKQMDALEKNNLIIPETRVNLLSNKLVLVTPKNGVKVNKFQDLTKAEVKKIALAEPKSVPAGKYAEEVLSNLGIFNQLQPKFVYGNNVRQVLTFVETGNTDAGIVYLTDAKESKLVEVREIASEKLHSPIIYPVAVIKSSKNIKSAKEFVKFLSEKSAKEVFKKYAFGLND